MQKVTLSAETPDSIKWPSSCPACGNSIGETEGLSIEVKVKKGIKATFAGKPKTINVKFCPRCASRTSWAGGIEKFGWGLAGVTFLLAAFVHPPRNQLEWSGAGAAFWLGGILGWFGESRKKSILGLQTTRISKNTWLFQFKNKPFADVFLATNQVIVKKD